VTPVWGEGGGDEFTLLLFFSCVRAFFYFLLTWTTFAEVLLAFKFYAVESDVNFSKSVY